MSTLKQVIFFPFYSVIKAKIECCNLVPLAMVICVIFFSKGCPLFPGSYVLSFGSWKLYLDEDVEESPFCNIYIFF